MGYSPWGCNESDMTKQLTHTHLPWRNGTRCHDLRGFKKIIFLLIYLIVPGLSCSTGDLVP